MLTSPDSLVNPKRRSRDASLAPALTGYDYYAAYSSPFVHSVFDHFQLPTGATVLDPWNGSGTTTRVAKWRKVNSIGFDLNPATLVVARAGLTDWATISGSVAPLSQHLIEQTQSMLAYKRPLPRGASEPFNQWFTSSTSGILRTFELTVRSTLVGLSSAETTQFSPLAAFFYLALFRTVRELTKSFSGSNPTWIKTAKNQDERIRVTENDVFTVFNGIMDELCHAFTDWEGHQAESNIKNLRGEAFSQVRLDIADSRSLPMADKSVDAVITSPPYCTRIDYVVAMLPELAVIGFPTSDIYALKRRLLGTTTVPQALPQPQSSWGDTCLDLLRKIECHPSRASDTYYIKWAAQYFHSLQSSLNEINRVVRPSSPCAIVVQDSYYKEVKIDLPAIVREMAGQLGWRFEGKSSYIDKNTMASLNPKAKVYRDQAHSEECVLVFKVGN